MIIRFAPEELFWQPQAQAGADTGETLVPLSEWEMLLILSPKGKAENGANHQLLIYEKSGPEERG